MRALVTGHKGFIGSHIYKAVGTYGMDIKGTDSRNCTHPEDYPVEEEKIDVIFHTAANASIPDSLEYPHQSNDNNVGATIEVLEFARKHKCPVIYSSSSSIYGDVQTPYSLQKSIGEQYLKLYWELYKVPSTSLRYFNVYGEGQPDYGAYKLVMGIFLRQYKQGNPFTIVGTGNQRRDFIHVDDVVRANLEAYKNVKGCQVYDVGSGVNHSINEVADMIDSEHPRTRLTRRVEPFINLATLTKFKPRIKLEEWIRQQAK